MTQSQVDPSTLPAAGSGEAPVGFAEILSELDRDATGDAGSQFTALVARYLSMAYGAVGPVSTVRTSSELSARFDEPLPRVGAPLAEVLERLDTQVLGDLNRLAHPMAMGHQVSPPLPASLPCWMRWLAFFSSSSITVTN